MADIDNYRRAVCELIERYAKFKPSHGEIDTETIIDPEKDHYELMHIGWDGPRRIHGAVIHIDIIGDKVWIQHDGTSVGVAFELVEAGVPREAIVLGYKPRNVRQHTGFAVA
jgi:hypothetical protein